MKELLELYGLNKAGVAITNFGSGLINQTWLVSDDSKYILQKINKAIFTKPALIDKNMNLISNYIRQNKPSYTFITALPSADNKTLVHYHDEYYRLIKFVPSKTYLIVEDAHIAFESAKQFGKFTHTLSGFDAGKLYETIPHFHDIRLRYNQFTEALESGNQTRINQSEKIIETIQQHRNIVEAYNHILQNPSFKKRVTHHDTKISNVLFDENNNGIAVIDLDTVMPGYFISDVGDMLRTYLPPLSEEAADFNLIEVRDAYFKAIAQGYLSEMKDELSTEELNAFVYAGKFMIYMQALRFITDYFNNDTYYKTTYAEQNLNRTKNQLQLLKCLIDKEDQYNSVIRQLINVN